MENSTPKFQHITLPIEIEEFWDWDYKSYFEKSDIKDKAVWILNSSLFKKAVFLKKEDDKWEMLESIFV